MAKWLQRLTPALTLTAFLAQPAIAQVGGPIETGLAQLASQIVAKSQAAGKTAIAVLPFPNADGSCSVLSNFIADELIQSLFSVPGSGLEIVERTQLEAVIDELRLGASGLLNPETTKQLGSQSGVGALTVGTITVIGDTVRINARLIATDSGKAVSAAAVAIPKVAAVSDLLKQPVTTGPTCTPRTRTRAEKPPQNVQLEDSFDQSSEYALSGDPANGTVVFKRCQACHVVDRRQNRVGPHLVDLLGRAAGSVDSYRYSDAVQVAGIVWTEETLDKFLENPKGFIPGNKMAFPGLKNPGDRADVIAYLKSAATR